MQVGEQIYLRAYGDEIIRRRIVDFGRRVIYVCRDEEFEAAAREHRSPRCIGFPIGDIVSADEINRMDEAIRPARDVTP